MRSGAFLDDGLEDNSAEIEAAEGMPPDELAHEMTTQTSYRPGFESALSVHQELLQIRAMLTV
jgi:hypothetical protein